MKNVSWDDLQVFFHVAESGGLTGAAKRLGRSAPTIGRRMLALEQQSGEALFLRAQTGYRLTPQGERLFQRVRAMQASARPVEALLTDRADAPLLRLSAGTGTSAFLADRISRLVRADDAFRLCFVTSEDLLDVAHREIDLGIRNQPAGAGNLASRKLGRVAFAPYRAWSAGDPDGLDWIAMDPARARHPAAHWVHAAGHRVRIQASAVSTVHHLVRAGAGIGVMPCMIADCDPALERAGPVIEDLTEDQYLVMHDDDRHRSPLRRLIERIVLVYRENADLLAGQRRFRASGGEALDHDGQDHAHD